MFSLKWSYLRQNKCQCPVSVFSKWSGCTVDNYFLSDKISSGFPFVGWNDLVNPVLCSVYLIWTRTLGLPKAHWLPVMSTLSSDYILLVPFIFTLVFLYYTQEKQRSPNYEGIYLYSKEEHETNVSTSFLCPFYW